ncbi:MAG: hypothetical protein A2542_03800 [Parcubacteria group bacterium RIFOXYD2_FULL_52_8]|nr:MAG: hypothetical protein A2542_03800 [Parcubacteria group bacterium RIFOXYD2_FULL_52_8]
MTVAYVPSWKKLATGEENPEPFTFWFMILAISALAASQGYVGGNTTAVWYGLRSLVISVSILVLMERLEFYSMLKRVFAKLN